MLATYIASVLLALMILALIFCIVMMIKNEVTCRNQIAIANAIFDYRMDVCTNHDFAKSDVPAYEVTWDDMEHYDKTLWRLWDWGYTRILPADKFEIVKPYIAKGVK